MKLERISPGHHQTQMNDEFTTATIRKENVPSLIYLNITCSDIINSIDKIRVYGVVILHLTNYTRSIKSIMIVVRMQMIISLLHLFYMSTIKIVITYFDLVIKILFSFFNESISMMVVMMMIMILK